MNAHTGVDWKMVTHVHYFGAKMGNAATDKPVIEMADGDSWNYQQLRNLKAKYPHLKMLVTLRHDWGYAQILPSEARSKAFGESLKSFLTTYNFFDGFDIDCEPSNYNDFSIYNHLARFATIVRQAMNKIKGRTCILSVATGNAKWYLVDQAHAAQLSSAVDYINIMA